MLIQKILLGTLFISTTVFGQVAGGRNSFSFLNLPFNAYTASLGGVNISSTNASNQFVNNAAIKDSSLFNSSFSYSPYIGDISTLQASVNLGEKWKGNWGTQVQYLTYGSISQTDETGAIIGDFKSRDFALGVTYGISSGNYSLGSQIKYIGSSLAGYSSSALATDIYGLFKHPKHELTFALAAKNIGLVLNKYESNSRMSLPLSVQAGSTFKPKHMPIRASLTYNSIQKWNLVYNDPISNKQFSGNSTNDVSIVDLFSRHLIIGAELLLMKNFNIRTGYNFLNRANFKLLEKTGGAGFSLGFLLKIKSFKLEYAHVFNNAWNGNNIFTLSFIPPFKNNKI